MPKSPRNTKRARHAAEKARKRAPERRARDLQDKGAVGVLDDLATTLERLGRGDLASMLDEVTDDLVKKGAV